MSMKADIVGVIWTFNPDAERFAKVLRSALTQIDRVIVVDNGSKNIDDVERLCRISDHVELVKLGVNLGVEALNIGISYAIGKYDPEFVLLLDDDTILYPNAVPKVLEIAQRSRLYQHIGALCLLGEEPKAWWEGKLITIPLYIFSGCLIRSRVFKEGLYIRRDFFLDQADHDFYAEIRRRGYLVAVYGEKLVDHKLGVRLKLKKVKMPLLRASDTYEPPWRYYYIARNSTVLLLEGKIDVLFYIRQLWAFLIPLLVVDGFTKTFRALILGLAHGLFRRLGYLDPTKMNLLSSLSSDRMQRS